MTLPATPKGSWISKELRNVYGAKRWKAGKGVDLNRNGRLEKNEKISTYNTNRIPGNDSKVIGDWTDWLAFYRANHSAINHRAIHAKVGKNTNSIFLWAAKFKTTNPLHIITSIESPLVKQSQVLKAYKKTWAIIARARKIPIKGSTKVKRAKAKLLAVYTAILKSGVKFKQYSKDLFIENMLDGNLDCDTASFVALSEAHEKGWPVFGVPAPMHFFVRWDDRQARIRFNMDIDHKTRFPTDRKYKKSFKISTRAVSAGVYLKNLRLSGLVSVAITNRAISYVYSGKSKEAIRDFTKAIKINAKHIGAYVNRGLAYAMLGKYVLAMKDYTKAIKLDPNCVHAYNNRGIVYRQLRRYNHAIVEFTKAINLQPRYAQAYKNRGIIYGILSKYVKAIKDFTEVIKLQPKHAPAYLLRSIGYMRLGKTQKAIKDLTRAIKIDGKFTKARDELKDIYFKRGKVRFLAGNYAGAASDFRKLLKLKPKHFTAASLIKRCTQMALQQGLVAAVRKVYGASKSESYVKTVLKTQSWSTLKQLGVVHHIQKAFSKLGYRKAAKSSYFAQRLLKKTLKNW